MYIYICVNTHAHTHTYIYIYIYIYIHIYVHIFMYLHVCMCLRKYICVYRYVLSNEFCNLTKEPFMLTHETYNLTKELHRSSSSFGITGSRHTQSPPPIISHGRGFVATVGGKFWALHYANCWIYGP